jgi:hypothetical protein
MVVEQQSVKYTSGMQTISQQVRLVWSKSKSILLIYPMKARSFLETEVGIKTDIGFVLATTPA